MFDLIVRGGRVVTPSGVGDRDVAVQGERIVAVARAEPMARDDTPDYTSQGRRRLTCLYRHYYCGGAGVGVIRGKRSEYFDSIEERTSRTEAPEACNCIESRATSMHTAHPIPCGSQAFTVPSGFRD